MNERLFQYIWQHQLYQCRDMTLDNGEPVEILFAGIYNENQGPDFLEAKVRIGAATWMGQVELHIKASDWFRHSHQDDVNYDNVILHVVWENDLPVMEGLPTLVLQDRVANTLVTRYEKLMQDRSFIPCQQLLLKEQGFAYEDFFKTLLEQRFERKAHDLTLQLKQNNFYWEELLWWQVSRAFGGHINADAFEEIARSIRLNILLRHKQQIHQLEGMLLGQSGLLEGPFEDDYIVLLKKEYVFLRKKYHLDPIKNKLHFLRMRPISFPTVRLAQLAMLLYNRGISFNYFRSHHDVIDAAAWFEVTANDFWHYHYTLEEKGSFQPKSTGRALCQNIMINAVIPLLWCYGQFYRDEKLKQQCYDWLRQLPAESNKVTRGFGQLGIKPVNAWDTQSLIELKKHYCDERRCLECEIGKNLLKRRTV